MVQCVKFEDFKVGQMVINGHQVDITGVYRSGELRGWSGCHVVASVDGGESKAWRVGHLCKECGVEYAKVRTGKASGTKVVSTRTEEERIAAKARLAFKDATKGLEAMEAAGLLSGKALTNAKKELEAKIKAEQERLTAEAVAAKAKAAEEAAAKKAKKAEGKKISKAITALDALTAGELYTLLKVYIGSREDAKAAMKVAKIEE